MRIERISKVGTRETVEFQWDRNHLFDQDCANVLFEKCFENPEATVLSVAGSQRQKFKPYPLSTVSLQKLSTSKLRLPSHRVMEIAEKLYNKGFISYPRTETDFFSSTINLHSLINVQRQHPLWGQYADYLLDGGGFLRPRNGKHDDKAHPPIHPVKLATKDGNGLAFDEWRVYELITRHFLACCSKDANGFETVVKIEISKEFFHAKGLIIKEYNWLEVYPYEKWTGNTLPYFEANERFLPKELRLKESKTSPPSLLTEQELIGLMDQYGIGTDATIHEHIKTIQDRQYAEKVGMHFKPTKLGVALVDAYEATGTDLWKPFLRASMEANMTEISKGNMRKEVFLNGCLTEMEDIFKQMKAKEQGILEVMSNHFINGVNFEATDSSNANADLSNIDISEFGPINDEEGACGNCNNRSLKVLANQAGIRIAYCSTESLMLKLPRKGDLNFKEFICPLCSFQVLEVKNENSKYNLCSWCYTNPPQALFPNPDEAISQMPCFKCPNVECSLSGGAAASEKPIFPCPKCQNNPMIVRKNKNGKYFLGCKGYPQCKHIINIPDSIKDIQVLAENCEKCGPNIKKVKLKFGDDEILPSYIHMRIVEENSVFCFGGCDQDLEALGFNLDVSTNRGYTTSNPSSAHESARNSISNSVGNNNYPNNQSQSNVRSYLEKYTNRTLSATQQSGPQQGAVRDTTNQNRQTLPSTALRRSDGNQGPSPGKMDVCSKCKKFGHNMANCPTFRPTQTVPEQSRPQTDYSSNQSNNFNSRSWNQPQMNQEIQETSTSAPIVNPNVTCMKCKQKGHYANQCSGFSQFGNQFSGNNERSYPASRSSFSNNYDQSNQERENTNQNKCFNCGETGHWATNCPTRNQNKGPSAFGQKGGAGNNQSNNFASKNAKGSNNDYLSTVQCYKCQNFGHFANACPGTQENQQQQARGNPTNSYISFNNNNNPGNKTKQTQPRSNTNTGSNEPKVCHACGHVGRHPKGSTCPTIKKKQVKKNNGDQTPEYDDN